MHLKVFSQGQSTEWGIFFGVAKFSILFGVLEVTDFLGVKGRCRAPSLRMMKK